MSPKFKAVAAQALELSDEERGELVALLVQTLASGDGAAVPEEEWQTSWSSELDRRIREVRAGTGDEVDGDEVLAELREIAQRP